jgi:diguanylate cyclase (GGDEF)-like protein
MLIDIDRFKGINDTHGHAVGDQAIKGISDLLRPRGNHPGQAPLLRTTDVSGRYGGDELAVILPETQPANGALVAERLRAAAEARSLPIGDGAQPLAVTLSVGVASFPLHARTPDALMGAADRALYEAKAGGRNRVALAD